MALLDLTQLPRSAALALLAALLLPAAGRAETAIRFTLDRKIDGPAAPFFLAIDKGYFKAEGLDVTIDAPPAGPAAAANGPAAPSAPAEPIGRLAAGAYDMGVADLNALIKFRDDNPALPIKALFVVFDKPPYAIIARKSRGIAAPKDLEGKKLGAAAADVSFAQWPIFAKVNGVDAAKVLVETVGLPVREPMLAAGEVDAITGCSFTSYVDLKADSVPADDLAVLAMADYGVELYGDAIMATPKFLAEKPAAARAFLRAYLQALKDTVRDPARAVEAVLRRNDAAKKDVELERLRLAIRDNIVTPAVKANGFGGIDPGRFAATINQLALAYRFKAKDKAVDAFDPSFLPGGAEQ
jgi:NitT/TauT family transport system substrate-binding protein